MRLPCLLVIAVVILAHAGAALRAQAPSPASTGAVTTLRTTTRNVILDVVVTDNAGRPVSGLTREDFVIREDGAPQQTRSFQAITAGPLPTDTTPRTILLLDTMNTRFEDMAFTRYAIQRLLHHGDARLDHPTALYVLGNHGLRVAQPFTRDPAAIEAALRAVPATMAWRLSNDSDSMLDRINLSMTALQQIAVSNLGVAGHKNLIWISPGFPLFSSLRLDRNGRERMLQNLRFLSNQLLQARISIDSVDPRGVLPPAVLDLPLLGRQQQPREDDSVYATYLQSVTETSHANFSDIAVQTLARQTGGHLFFGRNDIDAAIATSIRDGGTYYTLSYAPANPDFHGEFRRISVSIAQHASYQLRTREGYFALADEPARDAAQRRDELGASLAAPLEYHAIPILLTDVRRAAQSPRVSVRLLVPSLALTWQSDGQGHYRCDLVVATADRSAGGTWKQSVVAPYPLTLPAGAQPAENQHASITFTMPYRDAEQLRIVVQDTTAGRIGSTEYTLHSAAAAGAQARLTSPAPAR